MKSNLNKRLGRYAVLFISSTLLLLITGVVFKSVLYKSTGDTLIGFTEDQAIPYVLKADDIEMGCVMSEAFSLFIQSFSQVTRPPYQLAIMLNFLAGSCSEFKAWEEELRYLRAIHSKDIAEAQDARIKQKRLLNLAARRQLAGYQNLELAFVEPGNGCPDFEFENGELFWMIGLVNGLQAIINDMASEGKAEVPLDIALKVGRGANCLDNEKWWGMPNAIQAAIWVIFPNNIPAEIDPLKVMDQSVQKGLRQGVRISQVLAAQVYSGLGDSAQLKKIIRHHVEVSAQTPSKPEFRILDEITTLQLLAISDRLWTEATGNRTPIEGFGTFWDDPIQIVETIDLVDII